MQLYLFSYITCAHMCWIIIDLGVFLQDMFKNVNLVDSVSHVAINVSAAVIFVAFSIFKFFCQKSVHFTPSFLQFVSSVHGSKKLHLAECLASVIVSFLSFSIKPMCPKAYRRKKNFIIT